MHLKKNDIFEHLGLNDAALTRARKVDGVLDELCRDLEAVAEAANSKCEAKDAPDRDLVRLMSELEADIRRRLEHGPVFQTASPASERNR